MKSTFKQHKLPIHKYLIYTEYDKEYCFNIVDNSLTLYLQILRICKYKNTCFCIKKMYSIKLLQDKQK